jgi:hypothetical protein
MQSSKPSKKTSKTTEAAASVVNEKTVKPRTTKSSSTSKSKALNNPEMTPGSENATRKPAAAPVPAAATYSDTPKPILPELPLHHDEIAKLAYSLWAARGYQPGTPEEDWLRAEHQLKTLAAAAAK